MVKNIPALQHAQVMKGYLGALNEGARDTPASGGLERKVGDTTRAPPRTLRGRFNLQGTIVHLFEQRDEELKPSQMYELLTSEKGYTGSRNAVQQAYLALFAKGILQRSKTTRGAYCHV